MNKHTGEKKKVFDVTQFTQKIKKQTNIPEIMENIIAKSSATNKHELVEMPISKISPNPKQPRRFFDKTKFEELKENIRSFGVLQPIVITTTRFYTDKHLIDTEYMIIAGERRYRACKELGMTTIPAIICEATEEDIERFGFVDNIIRDDLHFLDEANFYYEQLPKYNNSQTQLAETFGIDRRRINERLLLAQLHDDVKKFIYDNPSIPVSVALSVTKIGGKEKQIELLQSYLNGNVSVREMRKNINKNERKTTLHKQKKNIVFKDTPKSILINIKHDKKNADELLLVEETLAQAMVTVFELMIEGNLLSEQTKQKCMSNLQEIMQLINYKEEEYAK